MQVQRKAADRSFVALSRRENHDSLTLIGVTRTFGRDQAIFGEGDSAQFVYRVVSGGVRSFRLLADGRRQIFAFHLAGDVFGWTTGAEHASDAEALCDTTLIVARRSAVLDDPDQAPALARHVLRELHRSRDHLMTLGRRAAAERIASFLIECAERQDSPPEIELAMSRQDIADHLGLTIETVSRTLTQMQSDGLIHLNGCRRVRVVRPRTLAQLCQ
jgi:CRP/FNR family nitrogen fixation transcriptional regulator